MPAHDSTPPSTAQADGTTPSPPFATPDAALDTVDHTRPRLVPDTGDLVEIVYRALDVLEHIEACTQDTPPDVEPWEVPAPLANSVALRALTRIYDVLRSAVGSFHDPDCPLGPKLFAPHRHREHCAIRAVVVDQADVDTVTTALLIATRATTRADRANEPDPDTRQLLVDLDELLDQFSPGGFRASWDNGRPLTTPQELLQPLAQLIDLLQHPGDDDTTTILDALAATPRGRDIVLTPTQDAAYHRLATRFNTTLTDGDPLSRFTY